jgi:hypothetical protein
MMESQVRVLGSRNPTHELIDAPTSIKIPTSTAIWIRRACSTRSRAGWRDS